MTTKSEKCEKCGRAARPSTFAAIRKIDGASFACVLPAVTCNGCGEQLIDGPAVGRFDMTVALELARRGLAGPEALRFMRKVAGLRGLELAELLELTPEHVSRMENGKAPADRRTAALLAALLEDKAAGVTRTLDQLRALARPRRLSRTVRVPRARASAKVARRRGKVG